MSAETDRISRRLPVALLAFLVAVPCAFSQYIRVTEFSKKLNDEKMYDYSEMMLKKLSASNPAEKEKYTVLLADTYIQSGKSADAEKLITSIPSSSKYYQEGQFVLGKSALLSGKTDIGAAALKKYLESFKGTVPDDPDVRQIYREAVSYLNWAYKEKGDAKAAAETMKYLEAVQKDKREAALYSLASKLDSAEKMKAAGQKEWKALAESTLQPLEDLGWAGQDLITLMSYVQRARAFWILGRHKESLQELSNNPDLLKGYNDAFIQEKKFTECPEALFLFWEGKNYLSMAEAAKEPGDKEKLLTDALKKYLRAALKYPGFPNETAAISGLMTAKDGLEKLGKTVKLPKDFSAQTQPSGAAAEAARAPLITGPLETLIKNKKHSEAAPKLLEFWASSKSKPGAEEILGALAECLAGSGQAAEAEAVLQYMLTKFGASSDTPVALLKTAQILEAAKKTDDEIYVCEMFLKAFPAHQHACGAAGLVANEYYKKASARLKDAEKAQGDAKKEKTAAAAAAFKTAVPYIKRIITDYPYKADAASSAYELLASAQTLAGLEDEAAKTWLDYRGLLKDNPQKLALVTLSASDSYFSAGRAAAEKARDIRERAMSLPQSDLRRDKLAEADALQRKSKELYQAAAKNLEGFQPGPASDPKTAKNAESAALLAAWASDAAGDKTKAIEKFKAVIKNYPKSEKIPSCMARLGSVYYETGDSAASTQILQELNAKYPASEEAKNAMFNLGKNLYESENYEKAFTAFKGMFSQKVSLPVSSLRWMAETLPSTPGGNSAEGAKLALEASAALMKKIESPDLAEWIGKDRAAALAANPAEKKKTISQLAQKTFLDAGAAANAAGDSKKAVSYLDKVLENKDTPYYFKAKFARADAWLKTGDAEKARGDWSDIAFAAAAARKDSLSSKAKCLLADSYMSDGNYTKALASLRLIAKGLEMESSGAAPPLAATEKDDGARALEREAEKEWVEYAVYKAFVCAGKTGDTALAAQLAGLYKKCFPKGTWLKDIQTGQGK